MKNAVAFMKYFEIHGDTVQYFFARIEDMLYIKYMFVRSWLSIFKWGGGGGGEDKGSGRGWWG